MQWKRRMVRRRSGPGRVASVAVLVCCGAATGQTTVDMYVAERLQASCSGTLSSPRKSVLPGQRLVSPFVMSVTDGYFATASVRTTTSTSGDSAAYSYAGSVQGSRINTQGANADVNGAILVWFRSKSPVGGLLTIQYTTATSGSVSTQTDLVSQVFQPTILVSPFSKSYRVVVDSWGVQVAHRTSAQTGFGMQDSAYVFVNISFSADTVFTSSGTSCGPALSGRPGYKANTLEFDIARVTPGPAGFTALMFGNMSANIPVPGTPCTIYTNYLVGVRLTNTAMGTAAFSFPRPQGFHIVHAQAVDIDTRTGAVRFSGDLAVLLR